VLVLFAIIPGVAILVFLLVLVALALAAAEIVLALKLKEGKEWARLALTIVAPPISSKAENWASAGSVSAGWPAFGIPLRNDPPRTC
jgi:hypothetical protein